MIEQDVLVPASSMAESPCYKDNRRKAGVPLLRRADYAEEIHYTRKCALLAQ